MSLDRFRHFYRKRSKMKQYKAYCFDLDGTVYRGKDAIPSAVAFIHQLQSKGIEPFYVTNNSSKTRQQLQDTLAAIGITAPVSHIYSSALATAKYIQQQYANALVGVLGSDGIRSALQEAGVTVSEDEKVDAYVMGIDREITFDKIATACRIVQNGAQLIGTNEDVKYPSETYFYPGNGSFVQLVANVAKVEPIFIGKPSPVMLNLIEKEHNFIKDEMVMIGDNYDTDILCGIQFGCDTIHVNTGVTNSEEVMLKQVTPTYLIENLSYL